MNARKAISPILATVIIIAVTLVIAIGVIGWIMGIWGTFGSTERLQIMPDSKLYSNKTIVLHVKNLGSATAVITKIEVVGTDLTATGSCTVTPGEDGYLVGTTTGSFTSTLATTPKTVTLTGTASITPGASYQVKVYTAAGNVYSIVVTASSG